MQSLADQWDDNQRTLARMLWNLGAFKTRDHPSAVTRRKERGFLLKAHEQNPELPLSPFYLNLRTPENPKPGCLTEECVSLVASTMRTLVDELGLKYSYVAGIPNAGVPFATIFTSLAPATQLVWLEKCTDGVTRRIQGVQSLGSEGITQGAHCLLVDDLITQAGTKMEAVAVCRDAGLVVTDLVVLVDRLQGGSRRLFETQQVSTHALMSIFTLLNFYRDEGLLSTSVFNDIVDYIGSAHD